MDLCPEGFHGAVLLVRGNFSDSNVAHLFFLRLLSTFMVGHFAYGDSLERRRTFDTTYIGRRYVRVGLLTLNIQIVSELNTNARCRLVIFPSSFELESSNTV